MVGVVDYLPLYSSKSFINSQRKDLKENQNYYKTNTTKTKKKR